MTQLNVEQSFQIAVQYHRAGKLPLAEQLYRQILSQQPDHIAAIHHLGLVAHQVGRNSEAVDLIRRAIALRPTYAEAHYNLGIVLEDLGKRDQAIASFRRAIALKPGYVDAYNNLGNALKSKGQIDEAIAAFRSAISLRPTYAQAHYNLGNSLSAKGQFDEAIAAFRQAIELKPIYPEAHGDLGNALRNSGRLDDAIAAYERAIALKPNFPQAFSNLGNALKDNGHLDQALVAYRRAIALDVSSSEANNNLGVGLRENAQLDEAIDSFQNSILLDAGVAEVHKNLAMALLGQESYAKGWSEFEWRWDCKNVAGLRRNFAQPMWDGKSFAGATLLLHAEQGFGDTFQFIRYLPMVAALGGKIVLECQGELQKVLAPMATSCEIVARGPPLPAFDFHCPLLSLPLVFGTTSESIPANVPYLFPTPDLLDSWQKKLTASSAGFNVALAWAGNPNFEGDRTRSISLDRLAPLAGVRGVTFYSIQKGDAARQIDNPPPGVRLVNLGPDLHDFADTAAVMCSMDLIITTDTSVAHLAAALGRPVWVMLQFAPNWRWLQKREDSPWYPTMRLFRQPSLGDWDTVIQCVCQSLDSLVRLSGNGSGPLAPVLGG